MDECKTLLPGAAGGAAAVPGRAVQVDPMKPTMKAPGAKRLKLNSYEMHSNFAFNFNLRPYSLEDGFRSPAEYDELGRVVQADPVKPTFEAPGYERSKLKCDDLLSSFAFKFNWRRYSWAWTAQWCSVTR